MLKHILLILCAGLLTTAAMAKDYFIYDLNGNPVPYQVCDSVVVVKFKPGLPQQHALGLPLLYEFLRDDTVVVQKPS